MQLTIILNSEGTAFDVKKMGNSLSKEELKSMPDTIKELIAANDPQKILDALEKIKPLIVYIGRPETSHRFSKRPEAYQLNDIELLFLHECAPYLSHHPNKEVHGEKIEAMINFVNGIDRHSDKDCVIC